MERLIPDLANMCFEYCWSQPLKKFAVRTVDDFDYSCAYGNYERVSELLEESAYAKKKYAETVLTTNYLTQDFRRIIMQVKMKENANWNQGLQTLCCVGYAKIIKLIINYCNKLDDFGIISYPACALQEHTWIVNYGPLNFDFDWDYAFRLAVSRGNKEISLWMKKQKRKEVRIRRKEKRKRRKERIIKRKKMSAKKYDQNIFAKAFV